MALRTRTQYKALYGTSGTLFPDNTTGEIAEADVRAFGEDGADSVPFTADDSYTWAFPSVNVAGTNTYTATLSPAISAYISGQKVQLVFANGNTGPATINLNGLGAKAITKNGATALAAGDISAGQALFLYYDGTQFQIQGGGSGTVADASTTVKGIVELATTAETTTGTDTVRAVTPAGVKAAIDALIGGAPGALDTLNELADALGDDAAFATTITNALALKAPLASPTFTGTPAAPTATQGNNSTQLATTAYVDAGLATKTTTAGVQDIWIDATAMYPRTTSGCGTINQLEIATSLVNIQVLPFDQSIQEFAQFKVVLPRKWNNGTITVVPYWTAQSSSGTVQWGISIGAYSNDDPLSAVLGTEQTSTDTVLALNDVHIGPATSAITVAGTPADADFLIGQVSRNPSADSLAADAYLLGISVRITTDAGTDA